MQSQSILSALLRVSHYSKNIVDPPTHFSWISFNWKSSFNTLTTCLPACNKYPYPRKSPPSYTLRPYTHFMTNFGMQHLLHMSEVCRFNFLYIFHGLPLLDVLAPARVLTALSMTLSAFSYSVIYPKLRSSTCTCVHEKQF